MLTGLFTASVLFAQSDNAKPVTDGARLLSETQKFALNERAAKISQKYGCGVYIVTVKSINDGSTPYEYAKNIYRKNSFGYGNEKSGVMLFVSMAERDYYVIAYGHGNTIFTDKNKDRLIGRFRPYLSKGDYNQSFLTYINTCGEYLKTAYGNSPVNTENITATETTNLTAGPDNDQNTDSESIAETETTNSPVNSSAASNNITEIDPSKVAVIILLPLFIAAIVCHIFRMQMKTARLQSKADNYIIRDSFRLSRSEDQFLYRTEQRETIESSSSDSSSSSTSTDSDGFSGTGGKF